MLVEERMSHPVITIDQNTPMQDALNLMHQEHIRLLPVVDKRGKLIGIISERDLLHASPSDVTSLSIWELNYMLSKIKIKDIMIRDVITISPDTPIEEAALKMVDNKIGGLPVVRDNVVVGIITETDLFKLFLELLGAREAGVRVTVLLRNVPGAMAKLSNVIYETGGNFVALGAFLGESSENREITMKVTNIKADRLKNALKDHVEQILDIRETPPV